MRGRFSPKGLTEVESMAGRGVTGAVDLRSDTVTRPSQEMRRAMAIAEVGDDCYGEDPSVNRLEQRAAEIFEREAAIFLPSGTMANQIAIHLHVQPGQEAVTEARSHLFNLEMGAAAAFSGAQLRPVPAAAGCMSWRDIAPALRLNDPYHQSRTGLVVVENTHNLAGGVVTPLGVSNEICGELHERNIKVHLDGARIFNAAVALNTSVATISRPFDSVMFCLSKGLGAPVGSILLGHRDFIHRARITRRMMGGGMRQAGVLAAPGLVALEKGPHRLLEDHENAAFLASEINSIAGLNVDANAVQTNIVIFSTRRTEFSAFQIVEKLGERNVLAWAPDANHIRFVTHLNVDRVNCEEAVFALRSVVERE